MNSNTNLAIFGNSLLSYHCFLQKEKLNAPVQLTAPAGQGQSPSPQPSSGKASAGGPRAPGKPWGHKVSVY